MFTFIFARIFKRVLGLGLESFYLWPQGNLSSATRSLASDFFGVLGLESCVLAATSVKTFEVKIRTA